MTPIRFGPGARHGGHFPGEVSPAQLRRGIFRARSALPNCEAGFRLLHRAGLRGLFRVSSAVLGWENRATKQPIFLKSLLR
jgi:hypothetical protein